MTPSTILGIYRGRDGEEVLDVLRALTVPSTAILPTLPSSRLASAAVVIASTR